MDKFSEDYDPRVDPAERWGEIDTTPENYSEFDTSPTALDDKLYIMGSLFTTRPEHVKTGLGREIGPEGERYDTGIADILVDERIWEENDKPEAAKAENGWYAVSVESKNNEEVAYDGFMRPVENLGWNVVIAVMEGSDPEISTAEPSINTPSIEEESRKPQPGESFSGHFMPYEYAT